MDLIKSDEDLKLKKNESVDNSDHHIIISKGTEKWEKVKIFK
jgi:hypothetical protein